MFFYELMFSLKMNCLSFEGVKMIVFDFGYLNVHVKLIANFLVQLQKSFDRFLTFYTSQHNGRKLNWLYKLSKVCCVGDVCVCDVCACVCRESWSLTASRIGTHYR